MVVLTHGAPAVSSVYSQVDAVLSAGYAGQGWYFMSHIALHSHMLEHFASQFDIYMQVTHLLAKIKLIQQNASKQYFCPFC